MSFQPEYDFLMPSASESTLIDLLDRLLDRGVVVSGELRISVAGVDLVHVALKVLLSSVDTAERFRLGLSRDEFAYRNEQKLGRAA
jgi:gas vesicle structural protein